MRFRRPTRKADSEERVLPLINVVFLLLIFFMLAGRLSEAEVFKVTPPVSAGAGGAGPAGGGGAQRVRLPRAAHGRLALNGEAVDPAALKSELAARYGSTARLPVTLKADAAAEALDVIAVMERLRAAGVGELELLAQAPERAPRAMPQGARP
ncbi:ExbD/TolR family protein [Pelagibius marinus]|uniref:ExbD/TolR family protein n=1 Tax=Pelagibius marinus TaxID=2762760 RepID=UPI0018733E24|nr:biopolymer transporter ExbD [Pelagibius marinus]